ncbi:zinc finger protein 721 [Drosophila bipectinata]|uniref:zinc finger protein 721 n=1 Tax=Drosophila bipectinata TaxID=42026 RepID=UPI001C8955F5|nr:zinc finger protein Xfin [Drosophila bipectinata]
MLPPNTCRTCALQNPDLQPLSACLEKDANKSFYEVLHELTQIDPLQESLDSSLPQHLCSDCLKRLENAYSFVQQARKVNGELLVRLRECLDETPIDLPQEQKIKTEIAADPEAGNEDEEALQTPTVECKWDAESDSDNRENPVTASESEEVDEKPYQLRRSARKVKQPTESENEDININDKSPVKRRRGRPPGKAKSQSLTSDGRYACQACGKSFSWYRDMQRHSRSHFDKNNFVCRTCGKGFLRKDNYVFHLRSHNKKAAKMESLKLGNEWIFAERLYSSGSPKRIECKLCNNKYERVQDLRCHLDTHISLDSLHALCPDSDVVREHYQTHSGDMERIKQMIVADVAKGVLEKFASVVNFHGYELDINDSDGESSLEDAKYVCDMCNVGFGRKHLLVRHTLEEHARDQADELPWQRCSFCKVGFLSSALYNQHLHHQCHNKLKKYHCRKCPGKFMWLENLEKHSCSHPANMERQIFCTLCDAQMPTLAKLRIHLVRHQKDFEDFNPDLQTMFFQSFYPNGLECTPAELSARIIEDFEVQDFDRYYNAATSSGRELDIFDSETEESEAEDGEAPHHTCVLCGKVSKRLLVLLQHQKSFHTEESGALPFSCEDCQEGFVCDALLQKHRRRCSAKRHSRFHCPNCNLHFMWQGNYERHLKAHHDQEESPELEESRSLRPCSSAAKLQCDECEKTFIWHKDLTRHKRIHQTEVKYKCTHCDRKFHRKDNLKSHMRVHSTEQQSDQTAEHTLNGSDNDPSILGQLCRPHGCKQIQCMICLSRHSKISDLRAHLTSHKYSVTFSEFRDIATASKSMYPELPAPLNKSQLAERIMADVDKGCDLDRFISIANESGLELTLDSSETDTESDQEENHSTHTYTCNICGIQVNRKYQLYAHHLEKHTGAETPYSCTHCQARFLDKALLDHHSRTLCRNSQKRFQCRKCPLRFRWRENLKLHNNVAHQPKETPPEGKSVSPQGESDLHCIPCQRSFKMQKDLTRHNLMHTQDSNIYRCRWCARRFYRWANLLQHIVRHGIRANQLPYAEALLDSYGHPGGNKIIQCRVCSVSFPTIAALRLHLETSPVGSHHEPLSLQNYSITNQMGYELTLEDSETDEEGCKPPGAPAFYTCGMCQLRCVRKFELQQHQQAMHRIEKIPDGCDKCIFKSVCPELIAHHVRTQCGNQQKHFTCTRCGYKFMWESNLLLHMQLQHENKEGAEQDPAIQESPDEPYKATCQIFQCGLCPRKYNRKDRLTAHIKKFHGPNVEKTPMRPPISEPKEPKRFLCAFCGKAVSSSSNLIIHMRRHTGEKPFKCDYCDMAFPRSSDLQCHRRTHTGERPHVCTVCQKGFARSYKLQQHMRIHSGERPYKCTYCEKSFTQSNDLTLHIRRHTGERPYQCGVCGDRFIQGTALKNHRLQHGHHEDSANVQGSATEITARRTVLEKFSV